MPDCRTYWRDLGRRLGPFSVASTSEQAIGPRLNSYLVIRPPSTVTLRSGFGSSEAYTRAWVRLNAGDLAGYSRRILHQDLEYGGLLVDATFGATVASGVEVDVSSPLPIFDSQNVPGLVRFINRALFDLEIDDRLNLTTVANQRSYDLSLSTRPWLTPQAIVRHPDGSPVLYDPERAAGARRMLSPRRVEAVFDGTSAALHFTTRGYAEAGFTFQLAVTRPAGSLINSLDSTTGLTGAEQTAVPLETDVTEVALFYASRWLSRWVELTDAERAIYRDLAELQAGRVQGLARYKPRARSLEEAA